MKGKKASLDRFPRPGLTNCHPRQLYPQAALADSAKRLAQQSSEQVSQAGRPLPCPRREMLHWAATHCYSVLHPVKDKMLSSLAAHLHLRMQIPHLRHVLLPQLGDDVGEQLLQLCRGRGRHMDQY